MTTPNLDDLHLSIKLKTVEKTSASTGDKRSLYISWPKDKCLADFHNLPKPDVLALEIVENLEAGLESFRAIIAALREEK